MRIDPDKCIACGECADYCPMGCILEGDAYSIDQDECVECGVCLRAGACQVDALYMPEESQRHPRSLRAAFSDPGVQFPQLMQGGRGTEEMKTNDVTGKFDCNHLGVTLEFGRPGTGTRLKEVEKITRVICPLGVHIEEANPLYCLLEDKTAGTLQQDVRDEKVLSCILEFTIRQEQLEEIVPLVGKALEEVDTVVSWGVVTRFAPDGTLPTRDRIEALGIPVRPNAKINLGLGRPLVQD